MIFLERKGTKMMNYRWVTKYIITSRYSSDSFFFSLSSPFNVSSFVFLKFHLMKLFYSSPARVLSFLTGNQWIVEINISQDSSFISINNQLIQRRRTRTRFIFIPISILLLSLLSFLVSHKLCNCFTTSFSLPPPYFSLSLSRQQISVIVSRWFQTCFNQVLFICNTHTNFSI